MNSAVKPHQHRALVVAFLMVGIFMVAVEATIIATAMPGIVGEIGGFAYYTWAFSAFLLAQTSTTVVYGKLSDLFGRRPTIIVGMAIFACASILCGFAWSMTALIVFRFLQGLGAGAIQPVATTIIGDLYTLEERGKVQGAIASLWGISAVLGPVTGAAIVQHFSWAWIFWVNVPLAVVSTVGLLVFFHETIVPQKRSIDYAGSVLFCIAILALLVAITEAPAAPLTGLYFFLAFAVSAAAFIWQENRAAEPIVSFSLWSERLIAACNVTILIAGFALIGATTMLPLYIQGAMGRSPVIAGTTLTMLIVGWPIASLLSGQSFRRFGTIATIRVGSLAFPLGAGILLLLAPGRPLALAGAGALIMGMGMGVINLTCIVLVQNSVPWSLRGSATASNIFARSLGNALGATALGAILNFGISAFASKAVGKRLAASLEAQGGLAVVGADPALRQILANALWTTFAAVFVLSLMALAAVWLIPKQTARVEVDDAAVPMPPETTEAI